VRSTKSLPICSLSGVHRATVPYFLSPPIPDVHPSLPRRKRAARAPKKLSETARKLTGIKAKLFNKKRYKEKAQMKKTISMHEKRDSKRKHEEPVKEGAVPAYLMDRDNVSRAKVLSNMVKQKRKEKAGKWDVPIPATRPMADAEVFKVMKSGKRRKKAWKRMVTKMTFVSDGFTRKPPKYAICRLLTVS
jgi:ribosome biogenesis protein NSA2